MIWRMLLPALCLAAPLAAADSNPAPILEFTGARVYSTVDPDAYSAVEAEIERIEAASPQTYYVVVIESSGSGDQATRNYLDRLIPVWKQQAAQKRLNWDSDRSVVVLLATGNRQIAVQAGNLLREERGLTPETVQNEIVPVHFLPHAKAGDYEQGLIALVRGIENFVAVKEIGSALQGHAAPAGELAQAAPAPPVQQPAAPPAVAPALATSESTAAAVVPPRADLETRREMSGSFWFPTLSVVLVVALVTAGLISWRLRWKKAVERRFAAYREQVVHLSEALDALKERHKLLPFSDPDFGEPMTGQTEALYRAAHEAMEEYRRRWLTLMDAWERAQALVTAESWLGARRFREAERLIREANVEQEMEAIRQTCEEPLDRLERAHEQSQADLTAAEERTSKLAGRLQEIEQAGLSSHPYQPELAAIGAVVEEARGVCRNDPIGAIERLQQATQRAAAWEGWIDNVLELRRKAEQALERLEEASTAMNKQIAEGLRFCEPGADPKPFLEDGWQCRQAALEAIQDGQVEPAAAAIDQAFQAADAAKGVVERTIQAKRRCEEAFAAQAVETRRREDALSAAQQQRHELERGFAADSWRDVAGNFQHAVSRFSEADAALQEAVSLAAPHVQHYQRAASLVEQAEKQRGEAVAQLTAVEIRLTELTELRRRCREELEGLRRRIETLADTLRRGASDRPRANERCREATRLAADLRHAAEQPQADWPRLEPRLKEVAKVIQEAERLAQEDARLAQQARDEIAKAQHSIRQAQGFSRLEVWPNLSGSQSVLDDAQRRLHAQDYEEAIRLAERAGEQARQALTDAERRANEKQALLDQERRQREAQAALAAAPLASAAVAPLMQNTNPPPQPPPPQPPSSTPAPETSPSAQASWDSNSSQNSW